MYVYIHIPFCTSICSYCDFPKCLKIDKYVKKYLACLKREIMARYKGELVKSIYIGGGTPTSLDENDLRELLEITKIFKRGKILEFTVESNVECLNAQKMDLFKAYGVNRVSLGVQSFNEEILTKLNRHHTKRCVFGVIDNLKARGINNISIDYIYGVDDDISKIKSDMELFLKLDIPHISCYSLIIEEGTIFGIQKKSYIDEDIEYDMYKYIEKKLMENGYKHYEVSNYSLESYYSIHNLNYWNNGDYYGFGLGAVSYLNDERRSNTKNLTKYLRDDYLDEVIKETKEIKISNEFILGLRKVEGINIDKFSKKYDVDIIDCFDVRKLIEEGKLVNDKGYLKIPSKYFYLANEILIHFV